MSRFRHLELPGESQAERTPSHSVAKCSSDTDVTPLASRYKNGVDDWMRDADTQRRLGRYESALRSYGRALECQRAYTPAWIGQAQMLILLGEPRQAEMWAMSGLKIFPNNADLVAARAQALCRLGRPRDALPYSDVALQGDGSAAYGWTVRGEITLAMRSANADHCFDSAEQWDPDWLRKTEHANIFRLYRSSLKGLKRAAAAVQLAIDAPFAWHVQGLCQHEGGFDAEATKSLTHALELVPDFTESRDALARIRNESNFFRRCWRRIFG